MADGEDRVSIEFFHIDELSSPLPNNIVLVDDKSVLKTVGCHKVAEDPSQLSLLQGVISNLSPTEDKVSIAETYLPVAGGEGKPRRIAFCALAKKCSRHNSPARPHSVTECVKSASGSGDVSYLLSLADPIHAFAAGCAVVRGFPLYSKKSTPQKDNSFLKSSRIVRVYIRFPREDWPALQSDLNLVAEGIQLAARMVDTPPNFMHTSIMVQEALAVADHLEPHGVKIDVIRGEELRERGFGGIYGVGKAAVEPPALVVMSHDGGGEGSVCMVGKGIVYDTGGLSIKTKTGMPGMKRDMGGAAAILGAFQAIVKERERATAAGGPNQGALHALLCLAFNAVDGSATVPDEVHTLYSGKTVEINNTDAEGRLVLGDGVAYAAAHLSPSVIVDMATLTGAQGIATGKKHAALYCNDEGLEEMAQSCGRFTGDLAHPMPYCPEFYRKEFSSSIADMKNSVADRSNAQVSCAGQFIGNHIEEYLSGNGDSKGCASGRWLHIDMSSPAHQGERATGYGVALLFDLVRQLGQEEH